MSLYDMMNPNGGVNIGRVLKTSNPDEHLLERILSRANMQIAWKRVKSNKGVPGVDKMTVSDFPEFAQANWERIRAAILDDSYQPKLVLRVEIPKRTGGFRPLGIPSVIDRLIQQSIYQVLLPIFDPEFSDQSYGFRPGRSAHGAVKKVREYICQGYRIAIDMDLSKFFDRVNHDVLMHRVSRKVHDKRVLRLIGKYLRAGIIVKGRLEESRKGVPQGGLCKALHKPPYAK
ncbi:group II intron reverse transcriptase/maturase [bacterium]|nr:group II intron reverse transcriptase/maturase [bacterium]